MFLIEHKEEFKWLIKERRRATREKIKKATGFL
jgi:hypothetical protein